MRRRLLFIGAILILAVPLVYLLRGVSQQILLTRIWHLAWTVRLFVEGLPQTVVWILLVVVAALVVARSFMVRGQRSLPADDEAVEVPGPVSVLTGRIQLARESQYSRRGLARDVRRLTLDVLAYQRRTTSEQLRQDLRAGRLDLPPEILDYLHLEQWPRGGEVVGFLTRLKRRLLRQAPKLHRDPALDRVVEFLESELGSGPGPEGRLYAGGTE
jgi:hypothetical protein